MKLKLLSILNLIPSPFRAGVAIVFFLVSIQALAADLGYLVVLTTEKYKTKNDLEVIHTINSFARSELFVKADSHYVASEAIAYDIEILLKNISETSHKSAVIYIKGPADIAEKNINYTDQGCDLLVSGERFPLKNIIASLASIKEKNISLYLDLTNVSSINERLLLHSCRRALRVPSNVDLYISTQGHEKIDQIYSQETLLHKPKATDLSLAFLTSFIDFSAFGSGLENTEYDIRKSFSLGSFRVNDQYLKDSTIRPVAANESMLVNSNIDFFTKFFIAPSSKSQNNIIKLPNATQPDDINDTEVEEPPVKAPEVIETEEVPPLILDPEVEVSPVKAPEVIETEEVPPLILDPEVEVSPVKAPEVIETEEAPPLILDTEVEEPPVKAPEVIETEEVPPLILDTEVEEPPVKAPEVIETEEVPPLILDPEVEVSPVKAPEVIETEEVPPLILDPEVEVSPVEAPEVIETEEVPPLILDPEVEVSPVEAPEVIETEEVPPLILDPEVIETEEVPPLILDPEVEVSPAEAPEVIETEEVHLSAEVSLAKQVKPTQQVEINNVRVRKSSNDFKFVLDMNKVPEYKYFTLGNPKRFVFDLYSTKASKNLLNKLNLKNNQISNVRIGHHLNDLRIVFDLNTDVNMNHYFLDANNIYKNRLVIEFSPFKKKTDQKINNLEGNFTNKSTIIVPNSNKVRMPQIENEITFKKQKAREQVASEQAAREQAAREQAAREKAAREKAAREKAAREQAAREQAAREKAAREQAAREQAAREKAAREQAAREQAAREKAAREQAAREQAARKQAARKKVDDAFIIKNTEIQRLQMELKALEAEKNIWEKRVLKSKLNGKVDVVSSKKIIAINKTKTQLNKKLSQLK
jgi:hypothetical protein